MELIPGSAVTPNVRLVTLLGEGGMGTVWVAEHLGLETQVAVKFISPDLATREPTLVARFKREAKAAAKINSPHVVRMFDSGVTDTDTPYMVMELLEGNSLRDWLELDGTLSVRRTALIVAQTAKALTAAHALGIVHRDIKPDNLFLIDSDYEVFVKVLDFGIAKQPQVPKAGVVTSTGMMVGTPEYMSPEQLLSAKSVDYQADLWALAVVAYEALTGQVPFTAATVAALGVAVERAEFALPSTLRDSLPPKVDAWFQRALSRDSEDRFNSAREMANTFLWLVGGTEALNLDFDEDATRPNWDLLVDSDELTEPHARARRPSGREGLENAGALPPGAARAVVRDALSEDAVQRDESAHPDEPGRRAGGERRVIKAVPGARWSIADDETAPATSGDMSTLAAAPSTRKVSSGLSRTRRRALVLAVGGLVGLALGTGVLVLTLGDRAGGHASDTATDTADSSANTMLTTTGSPAAESTSDRLAHSSSAHAEPSARSTAAIQPPADLHHGSTKRPVATPRPPTKPTTAGGRVSRAPTVTKPAKPPSTKPDYCKDDPYIVDRDGHLGIKPECL